MGIEALAAGRQTRYCCCVCREDTTLPTPRDIGDAPTLVSPAPNEGRKPGSSQSMRTVADAARKHRGEPLADLNNQARVLASGRFDIARRLGSGSFGVVYDAFDKQRQTRVALKTLHLTDGGPLTTTLRDAEGTSKGAAREQRSRRLYALKQEFRKLANISHPNVASLYELGVEQGEWFIAMELVNGVEFLDWVRPIVNDDATAPALDVPRLRAAVRGLAKGVHALHGQGILHSDLKPSNVMVTPRGRTVILDFGLVALRDPQMGGAVSGTPEFMSPEQALGDHALTAASDWYAVGSMLYFALTNALPFDGPFLALVLNKTSQDPPPVATLNPGAPEDLVALCQGLMKRVPEERLDGAAVLASLGLDVSDATALGGNAGALCIGREDELKRLGEAAASARAGQPTAVFVSGPSGIGKSCLIDSFVDANNTVAGDTVVLSGRCFAQESVPYKALDGVIDALHGVLLGLPEDQRAALLPNDVGLLARAFPVLAGLANTEAVTPIRDDQELKLRLMRVLRALFGRLASVRPVLVVIDDIQWADSDSIVLLTELLRPPHAPALCMLMLYRSEDVANSEVLAALRQAPHLRSGGRNVVDLPVGTLGSTAARGLINHLCTALAKGSPSGSEVAISEAACDLITQESGGEPFLISEYVRVALSGGEISNQEGGRRAAIDGLLGARIDQLPKPAQALLATIGTAAAPLPRGVAAAATQGLQDGDAQQALVALEAAGMIRRLGAPFEHVVEAYHDRIREVAAARVPEARRPTIHGLLGRMLENEGGADPETLMVHFASAGEHEVATRYALEAATKADAALAFDRAAALYERAVKLGEFAEEAQQREIRVSLGDAYRNAGRGAKAARAYLDAAQYTSGVQELHLRARAGAQYLQAGHTSDGVETSRAVLEAVGEKLPTSKKAALARLLAQRARLRMRGLSFKRTPESEIDPQALLRMDMCYEVSTTFAITDELTGSLFGARLLLQALNTGEPRRLSLAMGIEACFQAATGQAESKRVTELLETSEALATDLDDPFLTASTRICRGVVTWSDGNYSESFVHCDAALRGFTEQCVGVPWDRAIAKFYKLYTQRWLGHFAELQDTLPAYLAEAEACGDLYTQTYLRHCFIPQLELAAGVQADGWSGTQAVEPSGQTVLVPDDETFELRHWWMLVTRVDRWLDQDEGIRAFEAVVQAWRPLQFALVLSIEAVRVEALFMRGRCALAAARQTEDSSRRARYLREVKRCARKMTKPSGTWGKALGALLLAAKSTFDADGAESYDAFSAAKVTLEATELPLHAAVAQWYMAATSEQTKGRPAGDKELGIAAERIASFGVADPARYASLVVAVAGQS